MIPLNAMQSMYWSVSWMEKSRKHFFYRQTSFLDKTNSATVFQATLQSLNTIWAEIYFDIVLLVTDQAPYMIKVGKSCKVLFPYLLHVTCLNHALNLLCENIKKDNPLTIKLISQMKGSLSKSNSGKEMYEEHVGNVLPPLSLKFDGTRRCRQDFSVLKILAK